MEESITAGWPNAWAVFPLAKEVYSEDCPTEKKVEEWRWSDELDKMGNAEELEIAPHLQPILAFISQVFFWAEKNIDFVFIFVDLIQIG